MGFQHRLTVQSFEYCSIPVVTAVFGVLTTQEFWNTGVAVRCVVLFLFVFQQGIRDPSRTDVLTLDVYSISICSGSQEVAFQCLTISGFRSIGGQGVSLPL